MPALAPVTVYQTQLITVLGCPPWETNCPVRHGQTQAVVTATVGVTTTVCPLTFSQVRLSSFSTNVPASEIGKGGPFSTRTSIWPTVYCLPSTFPKLSSYSIPNSVWSSIFPSGAPSFGNGGVTGSFAPGEFTGYPSETRLQPSQASLPRLALHRLRQRLQFHHNRTS
jgi:hypothetical protein